MTSRAELVDLITSTAVGALDWHWMATGATPSPEATFRHVAEAIADALGANREQMIEQGASALRVCTCPSGANQHGYWRHIDPTCAACGDNEHKAAAVIDALWPNLTASEVER